MAAKIDLAKCTGCGECVKTCPLEVIKMQNSKAVIGDGCAECGACLDACPDSAISL